MKAKRIFPLLLSAPMLVSCAARQVPDVTPLSWEFGRDRYLTAEYIAATPGALCERQFGQLHMAAPLPDGTYFAIHVRSSTTYPEPWVTLERGVRRAGNRPLQLVQALTLDPVDGIVEGFDRGENKAYGIRTVEAQWLAQLGRDALTVDCTAR